jgi:glycosyltransferase involved in cell wall biosynthesis
MQDTSAKKQSAREKVNLLVFVPTFPVVTETFIERELVKLAEMPKLHVTVLALAKGTGALDASLFGRVVYKKLGVVSFFPTFFSAIPLYINCFTRIGTAFALLGNPKVSFAKKVFTFLKAYFYYMPVFAKLQPDFILAQFLSAPSTITMLVAELLQLPYGVSAHARDVFEFAEYVSEKVKTATFITVCNKAAYEKCLRLSGMLSVGQFRMPNVILRYHGVDFAKYSVPGLLARSDSKLVLFNNGRLTEKKGQKYLIEACDILKKSGVDFKLTILAGGGELYTEVQDLITKLGLQAQIDIVNDGKGIPFEEAVGYYQSATIFVYPGVVTGAGDSDGIPNVLIEAALFKLPIIATNAGSTEELVENGNTGVIVPQRDPDSLAKAIIYLAQHKTMQETLAKNCYDKAKKLFNLDQNVSELEKLIVNGVSCN